MKCATCKYWDRAAAGPHLGQNFAACRAHAPGMSGLELARWPLTAESDWCGEYRDDTPAKPRGRPKKVVSNDE
jgi:hypothetical protein